MRSVDVTEEYSLSPCQHGMFFHHLKEPGAGTDIEQMVCTLKEPIDAPVLRRAWQRVLERHAVLRTAFRTDGLGNPVQAVYCDAEIPWEERDWRGLSKQEQEHQFQKFLRVDRHRKFTMEQAPVFRLTLVRLDDAEYQLYWTFHHALMDGRSFPLILNEVFAFYESFCRGEDLVPPAPKPYRDYIDWLRLQDASKSECYWRKQLEGFSSATPLVVDKDPAAGTPLADRQGDDRIILGADVARALHAFAQEHGLTLNTLVQAAWALLLHRYCGENDIVYGVVRACRKSTGLAGADEMVGVFINTLPMRFKIDPDALLLDWLKQIRSQWAGMWDHEHTPLVQVQQWSDVAAGKHLFESILMFDNYELSTRMRAQGGKWENRGFRFYEQTGYPLTLTVYAGDDICLQIEYDRNRFESNVIRRMLYHLESLLEAMQSGAAQRLEELPMLTAAEVHQLTLEWNDTRQEYSQEPLHRLFEAQVRRTPDAIAVTCDRVSLTYRQLNERANQLAHFLRTRGVTTDVLAGICLRRSVEILVATLGVLKSGAAYVPLDPSFPKERLAIIMEDARADVLITRRELISILPSAAGTVVYMDDPALAAQSCENPDYEVQGSDMAYVIFTSGSTGRPKGVQIEHRSVVNLLESMGREPGLSAEDVLMSVTTLSFDIAGLELFLPLIKGAQVVLATREELLDGRRLAKLLETSGATVMQSTPATWRVLLESGWNGRKTMKILCGGEPLTPQLAAELLPRCSSLWNVYGPTETTIWSTAYRVTSVESRTPIGRPIANTQVYVLDRRLRPVAIGVTGELFIAGDGVARGYLHRPELTAERFIPDPYSGIPGARMYRTGDLGRWRADGQLECLGRNDNQVKIRGYRIELGDIEAALATHPQVKQVVVKVQERTGADHRLVGYVVGDSANPPQMEELRSYLLDRLPEYMVPADYLLLPKMPLTPNGKIDRKALPDVNELPAGDDRAWSAPENETEQKIAEIWEALLDVPKVGRDSNFFDLGGHSLLMIRVRSKLEEAFRTEIAVTELFSYPTVRTLAKYLDGAKTESPALLIQSSEQLQARKESARQRMQRRLTGRL